MLIVTEVTEPLFLDSRLPPLYVELTVVSPKTSKERSLEKLIKSKLMKSKSKPKITSRNAL